MHIPDEADRHPALKLITIPENNLTFIQKSPEKGFEGASYETRSHFKKSRKGFGDTAMLLFHDKLVRFVSRIPAVKN